MFHVKQTSIRLALLNHFQIKRFTRDHDFNQSKISAILVITFNDTCISPNAVPKLFCTIEILAPATDQSLLALAASRNTGFSPPP